MLYLLKQYPYSRVCTNHKVCFGPWFSTLEITPVWLRQFEGCLVHLGTVSEYWSGKSWSFVPPHWLSWGNQQIIIASFHLTELYAICKHSKPFGLEEACHNSSQKGAGLFALDFFHPLPTLAFFLNGKLEERCCHFFANTLSDSESTFAPNKESNVGRRFSAVLPCVDYGNCLVTLQFLLSAM